MNIFSLSCKNNNFKPPHPQQTVWPGENVPLLSVPMAHEQVLSKHFYRHIHPVPQVLTTTYWYLKVHQEKGQEPRGLSTYQTESQAPQVTRENLETQYNFSQIKWKSNISSMPVWLQANLAPSFSKKHTDRTSLRKAIFFLSEDSLLCIVQQKIQFNYTLQSGCTHNYNLHWLCTLPSFGYALFCLWLPSKRYFSSC